jgi:cell division protein FtsL
MTGIKTLGFCLLAAALPVTASLFRIYVRQDAVQLGYDLSREERRRDTLRATQQELEVELAAATSPGRLGKMATRLGLRPPLPSQRVGAAQTARVAQKDEALEALDGHRNRTATGSDAQH